MIAAASAYQLEEHSHQLEMPLLAAPKFAAGLIYGMVGENNLVEIQACGTDAWGSIHSVEEVIVDLHRGDIVAASTALINFAYDLEEALTDCHTMSDEVLAIKAWAQIFKDHTKLVADISKNMLLHPVKIKRDIADTKAEFYAGQYFKSGVTAADLAYYAIGPI